MNFKYVIFSYFLLTLTETGKSRKCGNAESFAAYLFIYFHGSSMYAVDMVVVEPFFGSEGFQLAESKIM